jgi:hypothetical protein
LHYKIINWESKQKEIFIKKKRIKNSKHYSQNLSLLVWFPLPKETDKLNSQVPWKHKSWDHSQNCIFKEQLSRNKRNTRKKHIWTTRSQYFEIQISQKPDQYFNWVWTMRKIISNSIWSYQLLSANSVKKSQSLMMYMCHWIYFFLAKCTSGLNT